MTVASAGSARPRRARPRRRGPRRSSRPPKAAALARRSAPVTGSPFDRDDAIAAGRAQRGGEQADAGVEIPHRTRRAPRRRRPDVSAPTQEAVALEERRGVPAQADAAAARRDDPRQIDRRPSGRRRGSTVPPPIVATDRPVRPSTSSRAASGAGMRRSRPARGRSDAGARRARCRPGSRTPRGSRSTTRRRPRRARRRDGARRRAWRRRAAPTVPRRTATCVPSLKKPMRPSRTWRRARSR